MIGQRLRLSRGKRGGFLYHITPSLEGKCHIARFLPPPWLHLLTSVCFFMCSRLICIRVCQGGGWKASVHNRRRRGRGGEGQGPGAAGRGRRERSATRGVIDMIVRFSCLRALIRSCPPTCWAKLSSLTTLPKILLLTVLDHTSIGVLACRLVRFPLPALLCCRAQRGA